MFVPEEKTLLLTDKSYDFYLDTLNKTKLNHKKNELKEKIASIIAQASESSFATGKIVYRYLTEFTDNGGFAAILFVKKANEYFCMRDTCGLYPFTVSFSYPQNAPCKQYSFVDSSFVRKPNPYIERRHGSQLRKRTGDADLIKDIAEHYFMPNADGKDEGDTDTLNDLQFNFKWLQELQNNDVSLEEDDNIEHCSSDTKKTNINNFQHCNKAEMYLPPGVCCFARCTDDESDKACSFKIKKEYTQYILPWDYFEAKKHSSDKKEKLSHGTNEKYYTPIPDIHETLLEAVKVYFDSQKWTEHRASADKIENKSTSQQTPIELLLLFSGGVDSFAIASALITALIENTNKASSGAILNLSLVTLCVGDKELSDDIKTAVLAFSFLKQRIENFCDASLGRFLLETSYTEAKKRSMFPQNCTLLKVNKAAEKDAAGSLTTKPLFVVRFLENYIDREQALKYKNIAKQAIQPSEPSDLNCNIAGTLTAVISESCKFFADSLGIKKFNTIITGLGPDELLGGYKRMAKEGINKEKEQIDHIEKCKLETNKLWYRNGGRDSLAIKAGYYNGYKELEDCCACNITCDIFIPFLTEHLINACIASFSATTDSNTVENKKPLRDSLRKLNIYPEELISTPKKAMHFGSNFARCVENREKFKK